ncbi:DUF4912 domain-containing protein [Desulfitibacter alkalitolerans]|uniref:DUF4912 domain-containing protein n=1 Tax=Desulfitibacter alkalitolerans TaxID=264641 RepID=UPI0004825CDD|nr:DUF4912 domain-containing protein [Desulfitibacter alkalitolerans]
METILTILTIMVILIIAIFVALRASNFMGRRFGDNGKKKQNIKASSEMINRVSPFNAQFDFEASKELSTRTDTIEYFNPVELHIDDETHITLLARNPYWLYAYWHIREDTIRNFENRFGDGSWENYHLFLKLVNLSAHKDYLLPINNYADSWYIKVGDTHCEWKVYLGKMVPEEGLIILAESNTAITPPASPSSVIDPEWEPLDEIWKELLARGFVTNLTTDINSEGLIKRRKDD